MCSLVCNCANDIPGYAEIVPSETCGYKFTQESMLILDFPRNPSVIKNSGPPLSQNSKRENSPAGLLGLTVHSQLLLLESPTRLSRA